MIYLKSTLAGLVAVFLSVIVLWVVTTVIFTFVLPRWGNRFVGVVLLGPIYLVPILAIVLAIFALGFYREFRRASSGLPRAGGH